jgi:hypothetical protein
LILFPDENDVVEKLVSLKLNNLQHMVEDHHRKIFKDEQKQLQFDKNGFIKIRMLPEDEVSMLRDKFDEISGGEVQNTEYGIYISLEDEDDLFKKELVAYLSGILLPHANKHFIKCKPHLGSYLVKAPGISSHTYPHQDWTFVGGSEFCSVTIWVALMDMDERNGTLGFIPRSHKFFDKPIGSPSPDFKTYTQGHEDIFYEYLQFVPLKAGEALVFNNNTIHGATPNLTEDPRIAVAIGMTPKEALLYHYFLDPKLESESCRRKVNQLKVDQEFFSQYTLQGLKQIYERGELPGGYEVASSWVEEFIPFTRNEIQTLCRISGLDNNGRKLAEEREDVGKSGWKRSGDLLKLPLAYTKRLVNSLFKSAP